MEEFIRLSRVVIVQSLHAADQKTGRLLRDDITIPSQQCPNPLPVELLVVNDREGFDRIMHSIETTIQRGESIILHIECHGTKTGIELGDGSYVGWEELKLIFTRINRSCGCNLILIFGACYGGWLARMLGPGDGAPCLALLGPTNEVFPNELVNAFTLFYETLMGRLDFQTALQAVLKAEFSKGGIYYGTAPRYFVEVLAGYRSRFGTRGELQRRARVIARRKKDELGQFIGVGRARRDLIRLEKRSFEQWVTKFFFTDAFPENELRFQEPIAAAKKKFFGSTDD